MIGFYGGLTIALLMRHTENLLHKIEQKNWVGVADFISSDYTDQWGDDRTLLLERVRGVFCYFRDVRITIVVGVSNPSLEIPAGFE